MISLRVTRKVAKGKWDEYVKLRNQISARAEELGLRPGKLYRPLFTKANSDTAIYEREFEDLADLQALADKLLADPKSAALHEEIGEITEVTNREVLTVL